MLQVIVFILALAVRLAFTILKLIVVTLIFIVQEISHMIYKARLSPQQRQIYDREYRRARLRAQRSRSSYRGSDYFLSQQEDDYWDERRREEEEDERRRRDEEDEERRRREEDDDALWE